MTKYSTMYDVVEKLEESRKKKIELDKLNYSYTDLSPILSKATMEYHYRSLAHGYVDRYNKGEGDSDFNYAGAFLHNIYFSQFRKEKDNNSPNGPVLNLIKRKYGWWRDFKEQFKEEAMKIQGSGWIYMIDYLEAQIPKIRKMAEIMRHIDYLYSGDHGDDSFLLRVKEVEAKYDF